MKTNFNSEFIYLLVEVNINKNLSPKEGSDLLKKLNGNISRGTANYLLGVVCEEKAQHYVAQFCDNERELIPRFEKYLLERMLEEVQ